MTTHEKAELVHRCQRLLDQRGVLSHDQRIVICSIPPNAVTDYIIKDDKLSLVFRPSSWGSDLPLPRVFQKTPAGEVWDHEDAGLKILERLREMMTLDDLANA